MKWCLLKPYLMFGSTKSCRRCRRCMAPGDPDLTEKDGEDNVVQTGSDEIIYPELSCLTGPSHMREI